MQEHDAARTPSLTEARIELQGVAEDMLSLFELLVVNENHAQRVKRLEMARIGAQDVLVALCGFRKTTHLLKVGRLTHQSFIHGRVIGGTAFAARQRNRAPARNSRGEACIP